MSDFHLPLGARDAAHRLGISRQEVYRLIHTGVLDAQRFGSGFLIPIEAIRRVELAPRPKGRPFSQLAAWELVGLLFSVDRADDAAGHLAALSRSRLSRLRRHLLEDEPTALAGRLRARARRHTAYCQPTARAALLTDPRLIPSGACALDPVGTDVAVGPGAPTEAYVAAEVFAILAEGFELRDDAPANNVVLHLVGDPRRVPTTGGVAAGPVVALDLIESGDPSGVEAGRRLWRHHLATFRRAHGG